MNTNSRTAGFLIQWQWLPMLLSAPLFALPSPWPIIPLSIVPLIWVAIWLAGGEPLVRTPLNIPILVLAIMILVSTWASYDLKISVGYIAGAVLGLAAYFIITRYGETPKGWLRCFFFFVIMNMFLAVVISLMVQWPQKIGLLTPITTRLGAPVIVLSSIAQSPHPILISVFLLAVLPLMIVFTGSTFLQRKSWISIFGQKRTIVITFLLIFSTILSGFIFLLSQSRGGYLTFAATCLILLLVILPPQRRWLLIGGLAVTAVISVALWQQGTLAPFQENLQSTIANDPAMSLVTFKTRLEIWSRARYGIQDFPFTGMGMNTFGHLLTVLYPLINFSPDPVSLNAHNIYLQVALDLGIPGLIAFLLVQFGILGILVKSWKTISHWQDQTQTWRGFPSIFESRFFMKLILLGLGGSLIAYLIFGLTESLGLGVYTLIWILIGLIVSFYLQTRNSPQDGASAPVLEGALQADQLSMTSDKLKMRKPVRLVTKGWLVVLIILAILGLFFLPAAYRAWQINVWSIQYSHQALNPQADQFIPTDPPLGHSRAVFWEASDALNAGAPALAERLIADQAAQGDPLAMGLMADALFAQGDLSGALEIWQKMGDIYRINIVALQAQQAGNLDAALQAYEAAWQLDVESGTVPLVDFLINSKNDYGTAEIVLRNALAAFPGTRYWPYWSNRLGGVLRTQKRWAEAQAAYLGTLTKAPDDLTAQIGLGWVYYERGDGLQAALDEFQLAVYNPESKGQGQYAIGQVLSREKRFKEADAWYVQALAIDPENRWFYVVRGNTAREGGELALALGVYQEGLRRFPDFAPLYYEMAYAYRVNEQPAQAMAAIEQAVLLIKSPNIYYYLRAGSIYEWGGDADRSLDAYHQVLLLDPANAAALAGVERLEENP